MREIFYKNEHLIRDILSKKCIFLVQTGNPIFLFLSLAGTIITQINQMKLIAMRGVGRGGQQLKTMEDNLFYRCSMLSLNPLPWRSSSKCHPRHFFKSQKDPKCYKKLLVSFASFVDKNYKIFAYLRKKQYLCKLKGRKVKGRKDER